MVAISVSRFSIVMDWRAFMHQTAYFAVQFSMNMILHHRILAFAVFAFHLTPNLICLKKRRENVSP